MYRPFCAPLHNLRRPFLVMLAALCLVGFGWAPSNASGDENPDGPVQGGPVQKGPVPGDQTEYYEEQSEEELESPVEGEKPRPKPRRQRRVRQEPVEEPTPAAAPQPVIPGGAPIKPTAPEQPARTYEPIQPKQVAELVETLDADDFAAREQATSQLIQLGPGVCELLCDALPGKSLESIDRGLQVIRQFAMDDDLETVRVGSAALQRLVRGDDRRAAMYAKAALDEIKAKQVAVALQQLRQKGAIISNGVMFLGPQMNNQVGRVIIGEDWTGEPADLQRLSWLGPIGQLELAGDKITDECMTYVGEVNDLQALEIKHAKVTDAGFAKLANLKSLQIVSVMYTAISDKSAAQLGDLKSLAGVKLYGTEVSDAAAEKLAAALPGIDVDIRHGAFLGVGCMPHADGCEITNVQANSAASKIGLLVGDVIVSYDGAKVTSFEEITKAIAKNRAGDSAKLVLLRGEEEFEKTVKLGAWE